MCHDWPKPPIWIEDLPLIRELLTDEEYAAQAAGSGIAERAAVEIRSDTEDRAVRAIE